MFLLIPIILILINQTNTELPSLLCSESIIVYKDYECVNPKDINYLLDSIDQYKVFTVKSKDIYYHLLVKKTTKTSKDEIPEIFYLEKAQTVDNVIRYIHHTIHATSRIF